MMKHKKKKSIVSAVLAVCVLCSIWAMGAEPLMAQAAAKYEPLTVAGGFNYDVIRDSGEVWTSTESLDQACGTKSGKSNHACLYTYNVNSTGGLPTNGVIVSENTSGLKWQLGSYKSNNALKLGYNHSGTLTFNQIGCYQEVYILSLAGGLGTGKSAQLTTTITYTDGSTSSSNFTVYDWWDNKSSATEIYMRYSGTGYDGSTTGAPYMVQSKMTVDTTKLIKSISFKNSTSGMYLSILGVTGKTADVELPAPETKKITPSTFLIDWEEADGASSYRLDVSKSTDFTTMVSGYNNLVVNDTQCLVTGLERDTTYYYRLRSVDSKGAQGASCAYKTVKTHRLDVTYIDNGGSGGPGMTDLTESWQLPASVAAPVRTGYTFGGYYTSLINGAKYFDENGNRVYDTVFTTKSPETLTLYAQWNIHYSTLTVDANGGTYTGEASMRGKYNDSVKIENPTYQTEEGQRTFLGWTLLEEGGTASDNGTIIRGSGEIIFKYGPKTTAVTLKAIWSEPDGSSVVVQPQVEQTVTATNLDRVYYHEVTEQDKGLTAEDLVATSREIVLTVDKITVEEEAPVPETVTKIENILSENFESLTYYDISVKKIIDGEETNLVELPETVQITIELTGELQNRTGYSVYRVHNGIAERMSSSRNSTEYYAVNADSITIYTKKFSTYAITASSSVIGEYTDEELNDTNNSVATDVQGMYVDSTGERVYKVDVEWGAMKFVFNKHQKWDPENHVYTDEIRIMLDESAYVDENNVITVTNHSNADVRVSCSVVEKDMDGVEVYVKQFNDNNSDDAVDMYLDKVSDASGNGVIDEVKAYVRLDEGMLNADGLTGLTEGGKADVFQQIARVVVTIEAVTDSETTPLYYGDGSGT